MSIKMVDMKQKSKSKSDKYGIEPVSNPYPYGLSISLSQDSINKLSLKSENLVIGSEIDFQITVKVTSATMEPSDKSISRCEMQIMKMGGIQDIEKANNTQLVGHPANKHQIR
jgi:hypothetical protein